MKAKKNIPAFLTAAAILTGSMALAPAAAQLFLLTSMWKVLHNQDAGALPLHF